MKNWIIIGLPALVLVAGWGSLQLYNSNMNYENGLARTAAAKAERQFHPDKIESVAYYNGSESYQVVRGTRNGVQMYFWVPDGKGAYFTRIAKNGITSRQALQILAGMHLDVKTILSVRLGAIQATPIWEITFLNSRGNYNYISINFDNGKEAQRILNI
ncbi:DUF5590 domain-containing protein [Sporolactobacillus sp. CQH2019]|uniref:cell wall elongation regulator TseB-like domain-containing protein n=1 Tax=Sporolactobacillus sp. CQH2019 TaxID=3023512 RepID=UPI002367DF69|nr:DUF5590 domain-containing protein [Sporolactobacillus sp. CQH2019]MDD9148728.1 DUF5590 domain-containing protein [Sporolactobacillus sp. CQH2019]